MSEQDDLSFHETTQAPNFKKATSNQNISSQKIINNKKQDVNTLMLSQSLQRSTYLNGADLEEDIQETPQQITANLLMLRSFHGIKNAQQTQQKLTQPKYPSTFNMEKSINQDNLQIHHKHHLQHQQVYESISSDHSSEKNQQNLKLIQTRQIKQTPFENHLIHSKNMQPSAKNQQLIVNINQESINPLKMKQNESPTIELQKKYNFSLTKEQSFEEKHATFDLSRKNMHITQKKNQPIFKRQQSYDLKPVTSHISNRTNIQKSQQNTQIKYPSMNMRSNSQQSGHIKIEAKKATIKDTLIEFEQTKDPSTSHKNLAYVSKRFTSEQPSPDTKNEFNQVYRIEVPIQNNQKKTQSLEEIINSQQQSQLLYISASGQIVYPSLDLGRKAKEFQNKNKQAQQLKMQSYLFEKERQSIKNPQKRRKQSTQPQLPYRIKILQYRSEYFLKIETQVFDIQVEFLPDSKLIEMKNIHKPSQQGNEQRKSQKNYIIKRRFSEFAFLYEGIKTNQIGYTIYPFPSNSLESFVKIKLQSLIGTALSDGSNATEMQKVQLLQRRIEQLQNFVNFLMNHEQLKHSQELGIFLSEDPGTYQKSRDRIEKYIQEYKELQSPVNLLESGKKNIKKALQSGFGMVMKWWGSEQQQLIKDINIKIQKSKQSMQVLVDTTIPQDDIEFGQYFQIIGICLAKFQMLQRTMFKICEINHKFISFKDIDTQFDYLVKLCAKVSSGKEYSKNLVQMIDYDLIRDIEIGRRWLQQSKQQLIKRQELKELVQTLKSSLTYANDESSKISKLERRIQRFQKNFRYGFSHLIIQCEKTFEKTRIKFREEWQRHSYNMKKIWK